MITVHHLNNSRSQRILWLLEELGVEYQLQKYQRDPETMLAPAELKQVHPLGKSPIISNGELTLAETGAIVEYLVDSYGHGKLRPAKGTTEYVRYKYWLHYAEGSAMPPLLLKLIFVRIKQQKMPFFAKPIANKIADTVLDKFVHPQLQTHFDYIESELAKSSWFAGNEFTAADIMMSFPLEAAAARGVVTNSHPHIKEFLERIKNLPAYMRALERGGEYDY